MSVVCRKDEKFLGIQRLGVTVSNIPVVSEREGAARPALWEAASREKEKGQQSKKGGGAHFVGSNLTDLGVAMENKRPYKEGGNFEKRP